MVFPRLLLSAALVLSAAACSSQKSDSSTDAGFVPTTITTPSSPFRSVDLVVGTGTLAVAGNRVTVSYGGWLFDPNQTDSKGRQFDLSNAFTFTLGTGQVIKGWDQGVVGMRVGGQRRLTIPPDLAYGSQGVGSTIPPNATLVFDIRLISVG
jgi:FKBP-type peptidyl-prolyl cis-trans isomerase FkpA